MKYKEMKHLRKFNSDKPQVGDYVLMMSESNSEDVRNFIHSNVGKIKDIDFCNKCVYIIYENVPKHLEANHLKKGRQFDYNFILHRSKNKEDLLMILNQNKYNL
jgi:hypothetical protein